MVELLAALRPLGRKVRISDEGDYRPRRSLAALRAELNQVNGVVAAAAGAMPDANTHGTIESPIFQHPQFERLAAVGAVRVESALKKLTAVFRPARPDA